MSDEADQYVEERWTYLGQSTDGYHWRDGEGNRLTYDKLKAGSPGAIYRVKVRRDGEHSYAKASVIYDGRAEDAAEIQVRAEMWDLARRAKQLEASAKRRNAIDETLDDLLALAGKLISTRERQVLADYVTRKIMAARPK